MRKGLLFIFALLFLAFTINAQKNVPQSSGNALTPNVNSTKDALWSQMNVGASGYASQDFEAANDAYDCQIADDFVVTGGSWKIDSIECYGAYASTGPLDSMNIYFYEDAAGTPGTLIQEFHAVPCITQTKSGLVQVKLPSDLILNEGTYWVACQANMDYSIAGQWWYYESTTANGYQFNWINPGGGFGYGSTWQPGNNIWPACENDILFSLYGVVITSYNVTFNVDMTDSIASGYFVEGTDQLWVAGSMNGWTQPGVDAAYEMFESATNDFYTITVPLIDGDYAYKYFKIVGATPSWDNGEWTGDPNRAFTVAGIDLTLNDVFGDINPAVDQLSGKISIYPNPSNGNFSIRVENQMKLEVYDITGKLINTQLVNGLSNIQLNTTGVYFLRFSNSEGTAVQRVVVQ
jgi:hypothetical protein